MTDAAKPVTACLIIIGNEILSGRTQDANLAYLGKTLNAMGIRLAEARVVTDDEGAIVEAVNSCRARHTYVFTTGGIGPTHDDITAASVAKAFGREVIRHPEAARRLLAYYPAGQANDARMSMADTPEGADLIDNPVSAAPGFVLENVFVLAGVPKIMQAMLDGIRDRLVGGAPMRSRTITVFKPEGDVARGLGGIQTEFPDVEIGSYPFFRRDRLGTSIVLRAPDQARIDAAAKALYALAGELGAETFEDRGDA